MPQTINKKNNIYPLEVKQLSLSRNRHRIINNLSFQLSEKQRLFLNGEIGTGKSSLLHALMGFIPYDEGNIRWFNQDCNQEKDFAPLWGNKIGFYFQQVSNQLFGPTVIDDIAFGPLNQGVSRQIAYQLATEQLNQLDILHLQQRSINELSGGEQSFVALAGILAMQPQVLLLDEPTSYLDKKNKQKLIDILKSLSYHSMLIASHDDWFCKQLADDIIFL